ncbi:MAG: hypothetical protein A3C55_01530 [Gammaproteobacteria bacterium RIFCSPHIGHO2_02_FULL_42_13]|nr:MAG: hypothetical protein A3C55_01530 [Gammaproteobacteria bacterium RIFCSPHIGHO2_02_FULL_42_13]OGT69357.1 MAG: hypothetical protein A3H43_02865 [Gammaproteobacteria bacterium RIFCSPLOWO2_02_FULL_42_9]
MKFSEDELRKQIADVRGKISSLESTFDIGNGSGFGGGISDERQINYQIQYKKDQESRLIRDLNDLLLKKTKKSSNIAAWLAAIAAFISAATGIITFFIHKP